MLTRRMLTRRMLTRRMVAGALAVAGSAVLSTGCRAGDGGASAARREIGRPAVGFLAASDQAGGERSVIVEEIQLATAGYVAIHADAAGAPGERLGSTGLLAPGTHRGVVVTFDRSPDHLSTVHAVVYAEDNESTTLDFPLSDRPVRVDGRVVTLPIAIGSDAAGDHPVQP